MTHTHTNFKILFANRSECNESEAKDMAGCIADGDKVIAYFPTLSAMENAKIFAAAPDLLEALTNLENDSGSIPSHAWNLCQTAISKATGKGQV